MPTFCAVVGSGMVGGRGYPMYRFPSKFDKSGKFCPLAAERLKKWCQALKRDDLTEKKIKYERVCDQHFVTEYSETKDDPEMQENPQNLEEVLIEKIERLQLQLNKCKFNRENFENNPVKCQYYTGLPNVEYIDIVYNFVEPYLSSHGLSAISKYERLVLTLMKLRKDFDFTELGYKFNIHSTTVSKIFHSCLFILYKRLRKLIIWPEREILHKTMPDAFKEAFGNRIAVIVDCFELYIERPSTLQARSQTFSHYKHHNTIKILIGFY